MKEVYTNALKISTILLTMVFSNLGFSQNWTYGKNRFTTTVDGILREYYVHVPQSYQDGTNVPMVFMLHGTSGDGEKFYDAEGWRTVSNKEGFIAVFPSSLRYKIITMGEMETTTKWNTTPDSEFTFAEGEVGADDIKFLKKVIFEMNNRMSIDTKRIYLNGFSNGGQMASRCAIEMSDLLAAVASNAGTFYLDTMYIPKRKLPILFQVGDKDYGPGNVGNPAPMAYFDELISIEGLPYKNGKLYEIAQRYIDNFDLYSEHTIKGDSNVALVATYLPKNPGPGTGYEFKYVFVKNLAHAYPNGVNHPLDAPKFHWEWMKQFELEFPTQTSISEIDQTEKLQVNPNPSSSFVTIIGAKQYSIYDLRGTLMYTGADENLDIRLWADGMYIVKSESDFVRLIKY